MNRIRIIGVLSLLVAVQASTIVGGYIAYEQMSEQTEYYMNAYKTLIEQTGGLVIDFGLIPNPFSFLFFIGALGLLLAVVLIIDQVRHKDAEYERK